MARLEQVLLDAKYGLRQLGRSPLTTAVAVVTLAVGIGMNTAVFSLVHAVLLRPLSYPEPDRLVWIAPHDPRFGQDTFLSRGEYAIWKQQTELFEKMTAYGTQDLLIGGEVMLAVVLLTAAGLTVKSLWRLQSSPANFVPEGTYTMRVPLSGPRYEDFAQKLTYIENLLARLEVTPGVDAAGISAATYNLPVTVPGVEPLASQTGTVAIRMVSRAYLRAIGVSLVRGRWPTADEALSGLIVNETFVRRLIPSGEAIGKAVSGSFVSGTIVGFVGDFPFAALDGEVMPELYYPYQRAPQTRSIVVEVRMSAAAVATVRQLVADADRTQPVYQFRSLEQSLSESIGPRRFNMFLLEAFAASAVVMALAGVFAVVARSVSRRTREIAVRIAIGARPASVVLTVAGYAAAHVAAGVMLGVVAAIGAGHAMRAMLHGVSPYDVATLSLVAGTVAVSALAACCLPAVRAARVDPLVALRCE